MMTNRIVFIDAIPLNASWLKRSRKAASVWSLDENTKNADWTKKTPDTLDALKPKQQPDASRAFCPGEPGSGIDPTCGSGKGDASDGDGDTAKAGDGPLMKAARDEHKKGLDKLRKNIEASQDKAYGKFEAKAEVHLAAKMALHEHLIAVEKLSQEHFTLTQKMTADPTNSLLADKVNEAGQKLTDARVAISPLEKAESKARKEMGKARAASVNALVNTLAKDSAAVDKEDGFTTDDRQRSIDAVEATHLENSQVTDWERQQTTPTDSVALSKQPHAAEQRKTAQEFLRAAVNPMIHTRALEAPIQYTEGVRANATGSAFVNEDGGSYGDIGRVELSNTDYASTIIHEFGHQIEHGNPEAAKLCDDFLTSRVGSETPVSFSEKFSSGYAADEVGSPDDFTKAVLAVHGRESSPFAEQEAEKIAHYAGKRYASQGAPSKGYKTYGATEVLSIGMELMHRDARAFAKADPEWFDLVAGISTGRILTKTRKARIANNDSEGDFDSD